MFPANASRLIFISQLKETQSKLKGETSLHYNDEEAQLQMRFRRLVVCNKCQLIHVSAIPQSVIRYTSLQADKHSTNQRNVTRQLN